VVQVVKIGKDLKWKNFFLKKKVDFLNQPFFRVWVTVI